MATRDGSIKIYGPFAHRARWRVYVITPDGRRTYASESDGGPQGFSSEAAALAYVKYLRALHENRTIAATVDAYLEHRRAIGKKARGVTTDRYRLQAVLRHHKRDQLLRSLTPKTAGELIAKRRNKRDGTPRPFDTVFGELCVVRAFCVWCVKQGWLASDPFAEIELEGQKAHGKAQLRINESRTFTDAALAEGTKGGLAAAMAIVMGCRASEITDRVVRDVDDGGRVLWIERGKNKNAERQLEIPEVFRAPLLAMCAKRFALEPLFGMNERGKPCDRHWILRNVKRIAKAAKVPEVTTQGLRGTQATISERSISVEHVAEALGHGKVAVTRRSYLAPGAERQTRTRRVAELLGAEK